MNKKLAQFDAEKDEWYYQPKIYINPKSADILYSETVEFRSSLSRDLSKKFLENLDSMLEEDSSITVFNLNDCGWFNPYSGIC